MSVKSKATAEVFFTAFKALPKAERDEVVGHMAIARCAATCWIWRPSRSASRNRLAPSTNTSASVAHDNERALVFRTDQTDRRKGNGQPAPFGIRPDRRVDSCVGNRPPRPHGSRKLRGSEQYRLRVGTYRILYTVDDSHHLVEIIAVGHRKDVDRCPPGCCHGTRHLLVDREWT